MAAVVPVSAVPAEDPMVSALTKFVTTGTGARHVSGSKISDAVSTALQKPGGREYLALLCSCGDDQHPSPTKRTWKYETSASGTVELSKFGATFDFDAPELHTHFHGVSPEFFIPGTGFVRGTLFYNDESTLLPGEVKTDFWSEGSTLYFELNRNQEYIGCFVFYNIPFTMLPYVVHQGTGTVS